jgi:hypothetical protein
MDDNHDENKGDDENDDNDEDFPVWCRKIPKDHYSEEQQPPPPPQQPQSPQEQNESWDPHVLRRIRIHYVSSLCELLQDLLQVLGTPYREHPTSAIVIDDLDRLILDDVVEELPARPQSHSTSRFSHPTNTSAQLTTKMMQACK